MNKASVCDVCCEVVDGENGDSSVSAAQAHYWVTKLHVPSGTKTRVIVQIDPTLDNRALAKVLRTCGVLAKGQSIREVCYFDSHYSSFSVEPTKSPYTVYLFDIIKKFPFTETDLLKDEG